MKVILSFVSAQLIHIVITLMYLQMQLVDISNLISTYQKTTYLITQFCLSLLKCLFVSKCPFVIKHYSLLCFYYLENAIHLLMPGLVSEKSLADSSWACRIDQRRTCNLAMLLVFHGWQRIVIIPWVHLVQLCFQTKPEWEEESQFRQTFSGCEDWVSLEMSFCLV